MGAHAAGTTLVGKSLQAEYAKACREAELEYGHQEGYNGTISTSDDVREVTLKFGRVKLTTVIQAIETYEHDPKGALKRIPPRLQAQIIALSRDFEDSKWGTWLAIIPPYSVTKEHKERQGLAGTRAKVWIVIGLAAS